MSKNKQKSYTKTKTTIWWEWNEKLKIQHEYYLKKDFIIIEIEKSR